MSDSLRPHRRQPTGLPHPWDSPGKNTGVGWHFLLQFMKVKSEREVAQSCLTLSDPMDCSPPDFSIPGIFQARVLEWGAIDTHISWWGCLKELVLPRFSALRGQPAWDHIKVPIFYTHYFAPTHSLLYEFIPCTIGCLIASLDFTQDMPVIPSPSSQVIIIKISSYIARYPLAGKINPSLGPLN